MVSANRRRCPDGEGLALPELQGGAGFRRVFPTQAGASIGQAGLDADTSKAFVGSWSTYPSDWVTIEGTPSWPLFTTRRMRAM